MTLIIRILFFIRQTASLNLSVKNPAFQKKPFPTNIKSNVLHKKQPQPPSFMSSAEVALGGVGES